MGEKFINALRQEDNWKTTENGQPALKSTLNNLVDLFGIIGSLRLRNEKEIEDKFSKAFAQDPLLALKILFYCRSIRTVGQGERRTARVIYRWLSNFHPDIIRRNLHLVPHFGRYDDLYAFVGTPLENDALNLLTKQLAIDHYNYLDNKPYSLAAKWAKSINTSSKESNRLGRLTAKFLSLSPRQYRKLLSRLRKGLKVTERIISDNRWSEVEYPNVPSKAMSTYRNAFLKHDAERFNKYLTKLQKGEAKVNASTLYPYDLVYKYRQCSNSYGRWVSAERPDPVIEAQWKVLPDYVKSEHNVLVMADTSGSMSFPISKNSSISAIDISLSLAIYFAERNKGAFKDYFMTFSSTPQLIKLTGETLLEKLRNIDPIVANTNLKKAFDLVLKTAIDNGLKNEDLPKSIVVISDMEFDQACYDACNGKWTFYDLVKEKYKEHGYTIPNIVFWNVNARRDTFHAFSDCEGVQMVSGASASVFKSICKGLVATPEELMLEVLNDAVFDCVII